MSQPIDEVSSVSCPYPLGSSPTQWGTNFSVFSASAKAMKILFFNNAEDSEATRTVALHPIENRTGDYWHIFVPGIKAGQLYGYRADGQQDPGSGQRFDPDKVLLDPYAKAVSVTASYSRAAACLPGDNSATSMKSVVTGAAAFDWEADRPLNRHFRKTVIYEMHVAGFTMHPESGVTEANRGTYLGVVEKIPYLKALGITAVELLPIFAFDVQDAPPGLTNYWGYSPVSFFAPHLAYSTSKDPVACLDEFRTMVKELHRAGIEVILDVVYNHTAEGTERGPTLSLRGLENSVYYILGDDRATYANYTGAGNTLKANQAVVKRLVLDSLRYWVSEMHVDGFRFDLASVFSRDESGVPMVNAPIIWEIDSEPVLAGTKLIAEAWDAGGLYQVGSFGPDKWKEWNGHFRDDVRSFTKGDESTVLQLKERLSGSPDLYGQENRPAGQSINFVTCHDGFTLCDLVSFNSKHNQANQELSNDGTDANFSWNCGEEGSTEALAIKQLRTQQMKNLLALTLLSVGTPMLLMGDEVRRTQAGNNNAYCQNNEISWMDWALCKENADMLRFTRRLIQVRLGFTEDRDGGRLSLEEYLFKAHIEWHGVELGKPDWSKESHTLAFTGQNLALGQAHYVAVNAFWKPLPFQLPPLPEASRCGWMRIIDTSLPSPDDIVEQGKGVSLRETRYLVAPRSLIVLKYNLQPTLTPAD